LWNLRPINLLYLETTGTEVLREMTLALTLLFAVNLYARVAKTRE